MENKPFDLKRELDSYISETPIFTEKDKKNVRVKILEANFSGRKKRVNLVPILAMCGAGFLFVMLLNTFVGDQLTAWWQTPKQIEVPVAYDEQETDELNASIEVSRPVIDPYTVKEGDRIGDLIIESTHTEEVIIINFKGELTLSGEFRIVTTDTGREEVAFFPDETSMLKIPELVGIVRKPFIVLHSHLRDLKGHLQLEPEMGKTAEIMIDHLKMYEITRPPEQSHDFARLLEVDGERLPDDAPVVKLDYQMLSEELVPIYQKLVSKWTNENLQGLSPKDVFQLYWQAFEYGNLDIIHLLLEGEGLPSFANFVEHVVEKRFEEEGKMFEKIKQKGAQNVAVVVEGNSAYVDVDGEKFELVKNGNGIWKVKYLP